MSQQMSAIAAATRSLQFGDLSRCHRVVGAEPCLHVPNTASTTIWCAVEELAWQLAGASTDKARKRDHDARSEGYSPFPTSGEILEYGTAEAFPR